jgi:hypothetical protein
MKSHVSYFGALGLAVLTIAISGCYTVTSRPGGGFAVASKPHFEQQQDFYLWGLVGESHIDTKTVCSGKKPTQMQSQTTLLDGLLTVVTLGIYAPHTAKVWCE